MISKTHRGKCTHSLGKVQHNTACLECRQNMNHRDLPQIVGRKIAYPDYWNCQGRRYIDA